jgi:hypothetical protein
MTGEREIVKIVRSAMLPGHYVFDMMPRTAVLLSKQAILTSVGAAFSDDPPDARIHR